MCGIAGILHPDTERFAPVVERMLGTLRHRGPDDGGLWTGRGLVLGHRRLSIIDVSAGGHQPMLGPRPDLCVTFNGEIYNFQELRAELQARGQTFRSHSDTEVILHLYEAQSTSWLSKLHGMFAFALWDGDTLTLARDRVGKKPLFIADIPGGLALASEIKALRVVPGVDFSVRPQGVHDYLSFGIVPGPETVYAGVRRVPPGHVLRVKPSGKRTLTPYWDLTFTPKLQISEADALAEIERLLARAVELRLRSDVPVGAFLSGGIDSGLVTAFAARTLGRPLRTYCIGFEDGQFDERPLARQVAERYGTAHAERVLHSLGEDHLDEIIGHYDEPFADASALPSFAVAAVAREDLKVVLNGDGGDELFAGYRHYVAAKLNDRLQRLPGAQAAARLLLPLLPAPRQTRSPYQFAHRFARVLAASEEDRYLVLTKDLLDEHQKALLENAPARDLMASTRLLDRLAAPGLGPVDRMTAWNMTRLLADTLLIKMDIASMASSLEARSPLLDQDLVAFVARLPDDLKLPGRETKPLLRRLADRHLPPDVAHAPKRGFEIPLQRWMEGPMNATLHARLTDSASFAQTHFDRRGVATFLAAKGWDRKRWAGAAWMLLCLEIWWARQTGAPGDPQTGRKESP